MTGNSFLYIFGFLAATAVVCDNNNSTCPCSNMCHDSQNKSSNDNAPGEIERVKCYAGFQCEVYERPQSNRDCAYCEKPTVHCESVCSDVNCPVNETCQLYRVQYDKKVDDKTYVSYTIAPICGNSTNPGNRCDGYPCGNGVCQLRLTDSCKTYGQPCQADPFCVNPCKSDCECQDGTYCEGRETNCPIRPCPVTYICTDPCKGKSCSVGYKCVVQDQQCMEQDDGSDYCTPPEGKCVVDTGIPQYGR